MSDDTRGPAWQSDGHPIAPTIGGRIREDWQSWVGHTLVALAAMVLGFFAGLGLPVLSPRWGMELGALGAVVLFLYREVQDFRRHTAAGDSQIRTLADGFFDFLGPLAVWAVFTWLAF